MNSLPTDDVTLMTSLPKNDVSISWWRHYLTMTSLWPLENQYLTADLIGIWNICHSTNTEWGEWTRSPYRGGASCLGSTAVDDIKGWASTQPWVGWRRRQHKGVGVLRRTLQRELLNKEKKNKKKSNNTILKLSLRGRGGWDRGLMRLNFKRKRWMSWAERRKKK